MKENSSSGFFKFALFKINLFIILEFFIRKFMKKL